MIDVVILAAGIGSRLAPLTDDQPKCLTDLNGKSLILRVVEQFLGHVDVHHITVVVGYLGDQITDALAPIWVSGVNRRKSRFPKY